ncbi:MAG: DUF2867 domain-containing protein [Actinomycetota bacterium]
MRVLIAGASGFIGQDLARRLSEGGHEVIAASRRGPAPIEGVTALALDVADEQATARALEGVDAAYYLVHSLDAGESFAERDKLLAQRFARAAAACAVRRIIYLGGLGSGELSEHLRSRQEVGIMLASTGVDVVELRAAVIVGAGSTSFEMMRYLVERLPAMVCPRWVKTPIEPIARDDVLDYLREALTVAPGIYGIGGPTTTYRDLMQTYARVRGLRPRAIVDVPLLTLHLSSYWVDLVTPVDRRVSHALIESLSIPVVVPDREHTDAAFVTRPRSTEDALAAALGRQRQDIDDDLLRRPAGLADGVHVVRQRRAIADHQVEAVARDLARGGGDLGWYGTVRAWRLRLWIGRLAGERFALQRPDKLRAGQMLDWWRVVRWDGAVLVLRADGWQAGEAWLAFQVLSDPHPCLILHAAFRPKGVPGFAYWQLLEPVHRWAFGRMTTHRILRAGAASRGADPKNTSLFP